MSSVSKKQLMEMLYPYFRDDQSMCLLVGDMGFAVTDQYFESFPERTFNVGIAEQATMSMVAGMAMTGLRPLYYSQIPFLVMRAFEQIRYDICEHSLNAVLIGVGADNFFNRLGRSHCVGEDDIKILSIFPNLLILSPTEQTLQADVEQLIAYKGPVYVRCV